jgi:hypothetical protein
MALTPAAVRRWLADFDAAASADRETRRQRGPSPEKAIALSLSLIEAARRAADGQRPVDARRRRRDEVVRATWLRLRAQRTT